MSQAEPPAGTSDTRWKGLYIVGGAAALITAVLIPIQIVVFIAWPPPLAGTASEWFALLQDNLLLGLLGLDLLLVVEEVLLVPILLAFYVALRQTSESVMVLATTLWLVGLTLFIASNPAFEMLSLSEGYAAATTDAQRSTFLAAGQAMLAGYIEQGTAFNVGYVLSSVAGVMIAFAMLRSGVFGKATAHVGIAGNVLGMGLYVPTIGVFLAVLSVVVLWGWYILIARRFFQLGRHVREEEVTPHRS
jgi:hypothetical protein